MIFFKCYTTRYKLLYKEYKVHLKNLQNDPDDSTVKKSMCLQGKILY